MRLQSTEIDCLKDPSTVKVYSKGYSKGWFPSCGYVKTNANYILIDIKAKMDF